MLMGLFNGLLLCYQINKPANVKLALVWSDHINFITVHSHSYKVYANVYEYTRESV